jgi:proteasome lid subunit RPN8/RPN11
MNDESLLWRPHPPSPYVPTGKVLAVPASTLDRTIALLRSAGAVESACLWLGSLDDRGNGHVYAIVVPRQVNRPRNYSVPSAAMLEVADFARPRGWTVVGAVHSHPGQGVEHSRHDDRMTPSRRAVSIVAPYYGRWSGQWPRSLGVHEYFENYWHLLADSDARKRIVLFDTPDAQIFDLRR